MLRALVDPSVILSVDSLSFCMRQMVSQLLLFIVGYFGVRGGAINQHNAALASNAAVLMSCAIGPEMKKNMDRLQGIIFGTVVGHLIFCIFGGCELWSLAAIALVTLAWTWMCLFLYYDSAKYGSIGVLMGVFGPMAFLQSCDSHEHLLERSRHATQWQQVIDIVFAVLVISGVDSISAQGRPSVMAGTAFMKSWKHMIQMLEILFDPNQKELQYHRDESISLISRAESLGRQAKEEPRFWKQPFEGEIFDECINTARDMRTIISGMEFSIADKHTAANHIHGGPKKEVMLKLFAEPKFQEFINVVLERMTRFAEHLEIFENDKPVEDGKFFRTSTKALKGSLDNAKSALLEEVNKPGGIFSQENAESIEYGSAAQVSLIIDSIDLLAEKIMTLQRLFVQH